MHSQLVLVSFEAVKPLIGTNTMLALELFAKLTSLDPQTADHTFAQLCSSQMGKLSAKPVDNPSQVVEILKLIASNPSLKALAFFAIIAISAIALVLLGMLGNFPVGFYVGLGAIYIVLIIILPLILMAIGD